MSGGEEDRLHVAVVHPYPWPEVRRGAARYVEDLSWYLAGRGHRVTVVTGTHEAAAETERPDGVRIVRRPHLRAGPGWRLGLGEMETFGGRVPGALRSARPDVVHAMTPTGALASLLCGLPTVYTVLGHPVAAQLPPRRVPRLLFEAAVRRAGVTATLSEASAGALVPLAPRATVVLPPGIRLGAFPFDPSPRTGPPRILFSGSLEDPRKRAGLAVAALGEVLERHPDARLMLSGAGDAGPALEGASGRVASAVDVAGPGSPAQLPRRYAAASVTVLPAEHEAFGLVLVESLACGTPVVCTPDGGMPEIVDGAVGRVATGAGASELAEAIVAAVALARRPGTAAACLARAARWSWEDVVGPAHETLYARLAGRPTPTAARAGAAVP
ncbi:MAG: glycosyltransferase family 4 protein [Acidobacteriota bacterium]|nr:glycosyltransferase family 4 protein [Acidobacteriota bacterium]